MKKFISLLGLIVLTTLSGYSLQDPVDGDSSNIAEIFNADIEGLTFDFEIETDTNTTKPFEYGDSTFVWDSLEYDKTWASIKYRIKGTTDWSVQTEKADKYQLILDDIDENKLWEYYIGTGNKKGKIKYESSSNYLNTICSSILKNDNSA